MPSSLYIWDWGRTRGKRWWPVPALFSGAGSMNYIPTAQCMFLTWPVFNTYWESPDSGWIFWIHSPDSSEYKVRNKSTLDSLFSCIAYITWITVPSNNCIVSGSRSQWVLDQILVAHPSLQQFTDPLQIVLHLHTSVTKTFSARIYRKWEPEETCLQLFRLAGPALPGWKVGFCWGGNIAILEEQNHAFPSSSFRG